MKTSMSNPGKSLAISHATAQAAPGLLKALGILSPITVKWSSVDQENLIPYWKSDKRPYLLSWLTSSLFKSFTRALLTSERRLTEW